MAGHNRGGSRSGRPRALGSKIRRLIVVRATADLSMPREIVADQLVSEIEKMGETAPSIETLKKYISEARNQPLDDEDRPWSTSTLQQFPLPLDAIPYVVKVKQLENKLGEVTIRQAQWISNLCRVVKNIKNLAWISWHYALYEKICKLSNTPFDTSELDKALPDVEKIVAAVEDRLSGVDFSFHKQAFEQYTRMKLTGVALRIVAVFLRAGEVYPVAQVRTESSAESSDNGFRILPEPLGPQDEQMSMLVKKKYVKKRRSYPDGLIMLEEPILLEIPEAKWTRILGHKGETENGKG